MAVNVTRLRILIRSGYSINNRKGKYCAKCRGGKIAAEIVFRLAPAAQMEVICWTCRYREYLAWYDSFRASIVSPDYIESIHQAGYII